MAFSSEKPTVGLLSLLQAHELSSEAGLRAGQTGAKAPSCGEVLEKATSSPTQMSIILRWEPRDSLGG